MAAAFLAAGAFGGGLLGRGPAGGGTAGRETLAHRVGEELLDLGAQRGDLLLEPLDGVTGDDLEDGELVLDLGLDGVGERLGVGPAALDEVAHQAGRLLVAHLTGLDEILDDLLGTVTGQLA